MKNFTFVLSFLMIFMLLAACATPPTEEMNSAHEAVARAENNADAVRFAGNILTRARDALTSMQNEADAKRYEAAKNLAAEAIVLADRAIEEGMMGAIRAREEAAALINGLAGPLEETNNALETAGQDASLDLDYTALSSEMDSARRSYDDARRNLQNNNFQDAIAGGHHVRSTLTGINAAITNAALAASRKQ